MPPFLGPPECVWFQGADLRYLIFGSQRLKLSKQLAAREYILNAWKSGRYCIALVLWLLSMLGVFTDDIFEYILLFLHFSCCGWNVLVANKAGIHTSWRIVRAGVIFLMRQNTDFKCSTGPDHLVIQGSALAFLISRIACTIWGALKPVPDLPGYFAGQGQTRGAHFKYWLNLKLFGESCPAC